MINYVSLNLIMFTGHQVLNGGVFILDRQAKLPFLYLQKLLQIFKLNYLLNKLLMLKKIVSC